jgi:hypothetical protein
VNHIVDLAGKLAAALPSELRPQIALEDIQKALESLTRALPVTSSIVGTAFEFFGLAQRAIAAAEPLTDFSASTPRALDDLPPARVDLERAGWKPDDRVTVSVRFIQIRRDRAPGSEAPASEAERVLYQETYGMKAALMGIHRELFSAVIFGRALSGTEEAKRWKLNVAGVFDWHYTIREARGAGKFWNWLNMGLGIHLASLDQGDDNIEFGVGGNITFWGGLVSGGYGRNLSVDRAYVFVGVNLFEVLNRQVR